MIHKYRISFLFLAFFSLLLLSCNDDDSSGPDPNVQLEDEVHEFVWNAMNSWYFFQEDVGNLSDDIDNDVDDFNSFLNSFSSPEDLFSNLIIDEFSYITDDFEELGGGLSAVYNAFGYDFILFQISETEFVGQIRFVFPGSQAEAAGLQRGDFFVEVDGQTVTDSNIETLLFEDDNYILSMATITRNQDDTYSINATGVDINVFETSFPRTAIWVQEVVNHGTDVVGYLNYSNFESSLHGELNAAFADFATAGVTELVLDLRYNPGGSVLTSTYLNSMIYRADPNLFMGSLEFNAKHPNEGTDLFFSDTVILLDEDFERVGEEPLNSLNLDRIFILTSSSTASASEFVINGLDPFIDVVLIGDTTVGKNLGSISIYDNPPNYVDKDGANPNHTYGLQPIVSTISNSVGFFDYSDGFDPDVLLREIDFLEDIRPLGDPEEQLFAAALAMICPSCRVSTTNSIEPAVNIKPAFESLQLNRHYQKSDLTGMKIIE